MRDPIARRLRVFAFALAPLALFACGSEPPPSVGVGFAASPPEAVLIQDVSVLEVDRGVVTPHRDVLLLDGLIDAVEAEGELVVAPGTVIVDGTGATLVPGLIDMHGHIVADTNPSWERGFPDPEANLRAYAYSGVTTVFDPADMSDEAFSRRERVARREIVGPRIFTTGPLLTVPDGHPIAIIQQLAPWWIAWYLEGQVAIALPDVATAQEVVDEIAEGGADAVKIVIDSIPLEAPRMPLDVAMAVVDRARSHGRRTVAHIGTTQDAIDAAEAGVALWVHGVYKERIPDAQIAKLAGYGIPMVATIEVFDRYGRSSLGPIDPTPLEVETVPASVLESFHPVPDDFDVGTLAAWVELARNTMDVRVENVRRLRAAGVTILAGSDTQSGVFPGAGLHRELANLVRAGMTPVEAIRAATLDPAIWLSGERALDSGLIAPGLRADLLLVEGDPTGDVAALQNLRAVYLAGVALERAPLVNP